MYKHTQELHVHFFGNIASSILSKYVCFVLTLGAHIMAHVLDQSKHLHEEKERNVLFRYKAKCILFTLLHIDPIVVECLKKVTFLISTFIL